MKTIRSKLTCASALAAVFMCATPAQAGIVVSFAPAAAHYDIGDTVKIDMTITGLGPEVLSGFDLNFLYDGSIIGLGRSIDGTSVYGQLGGNWGIDPDWQIDTTTLGEWGVRATSLAPDDDLAAGQADDFVAFRFTFSADADGVSTFGLGADPDFERNFTGLGANTLNVEIGSACIAVGTGVCSVPEPSTYALALAAFAGLAAVRRRRG